MERVPAEAFSYAASDDPIIKRLIIHAIERATGQPYLRWLYEQYTPQEGESFWDAAIRLLELQVECNGATLETWPKTGPLVVVCNHPYGVLDGIVACHLVGKLRPDFRVLTNAVICKAEPLRQYLLPIDFSESKAALATNLKSRHDALVHLRAGGCIVIFPAGGVSTTPKWWHSRATDTEWKTFTAKLITAGRAPVAPLYFAGQNSRLFQLVSHLSLTLRLALLFYEVHNKIGSAVRTAPGDIIPYAELSNLKDRHALMRFLRQKTYAAGAQLQPPSQSPPGGSSTLDLHS